METPPVVNGMDLSSHALNGTGRERDAALMMNFVSHWDYPETGTLWPEWRGVRTKQHTFLRWLNGAEELYDNQADPYQYRNLLNNGPEPAVAGRLRGRLNDLLREAKDDFLPGNRYREWFTLDRDVVRTAQGPVGK